MRRTRTLSVGEAPVAEQKCPPIVQVRDLSVRFPRQYGQVQVLDQVNLEIDAIECVGLVGESGCGKSLLGLAIADLLPQTAKVSGGVYFQGHDVDGMTSRQRTALRGAEIGIVFQDALSSLNPGMAIGAQLRQVCKLGARSSPAELLHDVGLSDTARILRAKPYQLSGGQRQRVLIALALAREPKLIVADEPTTALDVTVQSQVIRLLKEIQRERQFSLLLITHDLALAATIAQKIVVMYAGQVIESGATQDILTAPSHPYTAGLVEACLSLEEGREELASIPGRVRQPTEFTSGCRFRERCGRASAECFDRPEFVSDGEAGLACFHPLSRAGTTVCP